MLNRQSTVVYEMVKDNSDWKALAENVYDISGPTFGMDKFEVATCKLAGKLESLLTKEVTQGEDLARLIAIESLYMVSFAGIAAVLILEAKQRKEHKK